MPRYSWMKRTGTAPAGPNPVGVNTGFVGRPARFIDPALPPAPSSAPLAPPKGTGGIRPPDTINDVTSPPWWLGPPVREGGPPVKGGPPQLIGPGPTPATPPRTTRPPIVADPKQEQPPDWTPWDEAGWIDPSQQGSRPPRGPRIIGPGPTPVSEGDPPPPPPLQIPRKVGLPRNPGDNDMPPPREQSFGASEGWAGQGAGAMEEARKRFGRWPGAADPTAPQPPVVPGTANFNPFTGEWS